jgi:hypothetical protein
MAWPTSFQLMQKLMDGYRMPQPKTCPDQIYELMQACWQAMPSVRPTFRHVVHTLFWCESQRWLTAGVDAGPPCMLVCSACQLCLSGLAAIPEASFRLVKTAIYDGSARVPLSLQT